MYLTKSPFSLKYGYKFTSVSYLVANMQHNISYLLSARKDSLQRMIHQCCHGHQTYLTPSLLNFPTHFTMPQKKHLIKSPT